MALQSCMLEHSVILVVFIMVPAFYIAKMGRYYIKVAFCVISIMDMELNIT